VDARTSSAASCCSTSPCLDYDADSSVRDSSHQAATGTLGALRSSLWSELMLAELVFECLLWVAETLLEVLCDGSSPERGDDRGAR
jgi:hypothetical protein